MGVRDNPDDRDWMARNVVHGAAIISSTLGGRSVLHAAGRDATIASGVVRIEPRSRGGIRRHPGRRSAARRLHRMDTETGLPTDSTSTYRHIWSARQGQNGRLRGRLTPNR